MIRGSNGLLVNLIFQDNIIEISDLTYKKFSPNFRIVIERIPPRLTKGVKGGGIQLLIGRR